MAAKNPKPRSIRIKYLRAIDRDPEYILSELALLLRAGVSVRQTLETLRDMARTRKIKKKFSRMEIEISEGSPLWAALAKSGLLSSQSLALVELGEKSGNLVDNLQMAAAQEEKQRSFKTKVKSALLYPSFVFVVTLLAATIVSWYLLPRLAQLFMQMDMDLPFISRVFVSVGNAVASHAWLPPLVLIVVVFSIYVLFFLQATRHVGQTILFHIPGVARMLREIEIARFGYLLGTLLKAGLSITQALDLLAKATATTSYRNFYLELRQAFDEGYSFSSIFKNDSHPTVLLPLSVQQIIIASERSGSLSETLLTISDKYEEKADISAQNLETLIEPVLLVMVWFGVLAVAVSVILPVYNLVGGLGG